VPNQNLYLFAVLKDQNIRKALEGAVSQELRKYKFLRKKCKRKRGPGHKRRFPHSPQTTTRAWDRGGKGKFSHGLE